MPLVPRTIAARAVLTLGVAVVIEVVASLAILAFALSRSGASAELSGDSVISAAVTGIVLGAAAAALLGLPVALLAARSIARPVERLRERAETGTVTGTGWSPGRAPAEVTTLAGALRDLAAIAAQRYAAAQTERDRFATLLREMGDAVLVVAADDRIALANPAAERLLSGANIAGRHLAEVARDHELLSAVERARRDGAASTEIDRMDPRRHVRLVARRLPGQEVLVAAQDLTTVRRLETVRRDFVANVSHELRTPIASIKAMVETLESGALGDPAAASDFVARIHREVDDLAQLVTELLSLARIESGADALDLRSADPAELLHTAAERMRALADRAGVFLTVTPSGPLHEVRVDREKIATVIANLVHNAVKFTPAGGSVALAAERTDGAVRFTVRDTGIGIARDDLDRIFERFYKSDAARTQEGTGLGLAIAKHVVLAHGGEIHAESDGPGRGSTFRFTIPVSGAA